MTKDLDWLLGRTALPPGPEPPQRYQPALIGMARARCIARRIRAYDPRATGAQKETHRDDRRHTLSDRALKVLVILLLAAQPVGKDFIRARYARPQASTASKTPSSG